MRSERSRSVALSLLAAVLTSVSLLWAFEIIGLPWRIYAGSEPYYNLQAQALSCGQFSLGNDPRCLALDQSWANGEIHQNWGLGVPSWLLILSLATGIDPIFFPSRAAFAIALMLVAAMVFYEVSQFEFTQNQVNTLCTIIAQGQTVVITLFFPTFIALLKSGFRVYEEACAYGYLYDLFIGLMVFRYNKTPGVTQFFLVSLFSGLGCFFRPTVMLYGISGWLVCLYMHVRSSPRNILSTAVILIFPLFIGLLLTTNSIRFGTPFEFGYGFAVGHQTESLYALRFGTAFESESTFGRLKELASVVLFDGAKLQSSWFDDGVFRWQSPMPRWRESYLPSIGVTLIVVATLGVPYTLKARLTKGIGTTALTWFCVISIVLLIGFYCQTPAVSSRYAYDFSPAIAFLVIQSLWGFQSWCHVKFRDSLPITIAITAIVFTFVIVRAQTAYCRTTDVVNRSRSSYAELLSEMHAQAIPHHPPFQRFEGGEIDISSLPFNNLGWYSEDNHTDRLSLHFVVDPQFVRLQISPNPTARVSGSIHDVGVKIGLEELRINHVEYLKGGGIGIRYDLAPYSANRRGLQVVAIAWIAKSAQAARVSPWILNELAWGPNANDRYALTKGGFGRPITAVLGPKYP